MGRPRPSIAVMGILRFKENLNAFIFRYLFAAIGIFHDRSALGRDRLLILMDNPDRLGGSRTVGGLCG